MASESKQNGQALPRVAVVVSRWNSSITEALLEGALAAYEGRVGNRKGVDVYWGAGSYELPALALAAAETGRYRGVVALGCLIKGETKHDRYIAEAVSKGLMDVTMRTRVPEGFGVLTVDSAKQARARAGGDKGNEGADAMGAVMDAAAEMHAIKQGLASVMPVREVVDKAGKING